MSKTASLSYINASKTKLATTTHPEFNDATEATEVAAAFPDSVRGKTIIITGVNMKGVGFAMAEGLVGCLLFSLAVSLACN